MVDETRVGGEPRTPRHAAQRTVRNIIDEWLESPGMGVSVSITSDPQLQSAASGAKRILARRVVDALEPLLRECWSQGASSTQASLGWDFDQWYVGAAPEMLRPEDMIIPKKLEHTAHFFAPSAGPLIDNTDGKLSIQDMVVQSSATLQTIDVRPHFEPYQGDGVGLVRTALPDGEYVATDPGWRYLFRLTIPGHPNLVGPASQEHRTEWGIRRCDLHGWADSLKQKTMQVSPPFYLPEGCVVSHIWVEPEPPERGGDMIDDKPAEQGAEDMRCRSVLGSTDGRVRCQLTRGPHTNGRHRHKSDDGQVRVWTDNEQE